MLYILIALLITAIIGYCVETIRMKLTIEKVKRTSRDMAHFIDGMIVGVEEIDMFLINTLRQKKSKVSTLKQGVLMISKSTRMAEDVLEWHLE